MEKSIWFVGGFFAILLVTVMVGIAAKRRVSGEQDFSNAGGKLKSKAVTGALVGGFVGGTSIIGTGEMAFQFGLTALWFTLGGGLGICLLGLFAKRFRRWNEVTLPALIGQEYGSRARLGASVFLCVGMFIQVAAQIMAALPLVSVIWKGDVRLLALVPVVLVISYILLGGFMGSSAVGTYKTIFLLILLAGTGVWLLQADPLSVYKEWYQQGRLSLFHAGQLSAWANAGAMIVGIFSTQAYLQPIFAAKNNSSARNGALVAGGIIIILGMLSTWIGMFMHQHHPYLAAREAVPAFFYQYSPSWVAGMAIAIILLSVVMTGAALALGIGTILYRDVIRHFRFSSHFATDASSIRISQALIVIVMLLAYGVLFVQKQAFILQWTFLSMTLRGATIFFPVIFLLLGFARTSQKQVTIAIWGAPSASILWAVFFQDVTGIDPFYIGALWSLGFLWLGEKKQAHQTVADKLAR